MAKAKAKGSEEKSTRILTPRFRVSYPHVFKAQGYKNAEPKFSLTMLFKKDQDLTDLTRAIRQAKIDKWGAKENWPKGIKSPIGDGDDAKYTDKEGYADHFVIKASSSDKPGVLDADKEEITKPSDFYPGCYAVAQVFAHAYDNEFGRGVTFILDHVLKVKDGKSFSSKKSAEETFATFEVEDDGDDDDNDDDNSDDDDEENFFG